MKLYIVQEYNVMRYVPVASLFRTEKLQKCNDYFRFTVIDKLLVMVMTVNDVSGGAHSTSSLQVSGVGALKIKGTDE